MDIIRRVQKYQRQPSAKDYNFVTTCRYYIGHYHNYMNIKGSHQKKVKKLHNKCELWGEGVSKFWCVNLKKVLFLELIFQKKHAVINS